MPTLSLLALRLTKFGRGVLECSLLSVTIFICCYCIAQLERDCHTAAFSGWLAATQRWAGYFFA